MTAQGPNVSGGDQKDWLVTLLLCILPALVGINGIHRFYVGKIGKGFTGKRLDVSGFLRRKLTGEKRREQDKITGKF